MKLNKVIIENFRNIGHKEYDLGQINIFTGPNAQGKTNSILAIYWALSDNLMNDSSDYASFKPHDDSKAVVSVELQFDTFTLKKEFSEKWVKTRGSTETTLQGHETNYYVDDVKYGVTEGKRLIAENLGVADVKTHKKVDVLKSIINPYYLAGQLAWKDLRTFIIDLVGDVDDSLVLSSNAAFSAIASDLERQKYDVAPLTKLYKQNIKKSRDEITVNENIILGYKAINDVEKVDLDKANINLEMLNDEIARLKVSKASDVNPRIAELEQQIALKLSDYADSVTDDNNALVAKNKSSNEAITSTVNELTAKRNQLRADEDELLSNQRKGNLYDQELQDLKQVLESKMNQKDQYGKDWDELNAMEFDLQSLVINKCPHCGETLNQEELDQHKSEWELNKQNKIDAVVAKGIELANEIENMKFKISEHDKSKPTTDNEALIARIESAKTAINELSSKETELRASLVDTLVSDKTKKLKEDGEALRAELNNEKEIKTTEEIDAQIAAKTAEKEQYTAIVAEHDSYLSIQKKIVEVESLIKTQQTSQVENESKLMLLEEFIKTKLTMLKNNVTSVFGDLEFVLIEQNIKEGSYDEVCYPLILGKGTPFESGSGAEQIITGVHIIESVKKTLGMSDLPIIFDEADKLDTVTLATKLVTNSQIISTRVDDINYDAVTLVVK